LICSVTIALPAELPCFLWMRERRPSRAQIIRDPPEEMESLGPIQAVFGTHQPFQVCYQARPKLNRRICE